MGSLTLFVRDSNRIEGIDRDPTREEIAAHEKLLALETLAVEDIEAFVSRVQPGARLRSHEGMNVRVGPHMPPPGGPQITRDLCGLLVMICNAVNGEVSLRPWEAHLEYESLHPFTDGNGRSGRAIWAWQMLREGRDPFALPFLHRAYYEALEWGRRQL